MNSKCNLTQDVIHGLFDSDGSFQSKVYIGTQKPVSFHVNIIFSQKEKPWIEAVLLSLDAVFNDDGTPRKITERLAKNKEGFEFLSHSTSLAFSSEAGQLLLKSWEIEPPKAPTKYLDYRISLILVQVSQEQVSQENPDTALKVVKKYLPNYDFSSNSITEKIAGFALLYLRFRKHGLTVTKRNPNTTSIETHYEESNLTPNEIERSVEIGKLLYEPIEKDLIKHNTLLVNSYVSNDFLLGYHMGDGSFWIQTIFGANCKSFKCKFGWSLTDCKENMSLLLAVKKRLESEGVEFAEKAISEPDKTNDITLQSTSVRGARKIIQLFDQFDWQPVPPVRKNQYFTFKKAFKIYDTNDFREYLTKLEQIIRYKWLLNPNTTQKKHGTIKGDLQKVTVYFNTANKRNRKR